MRDYTENSLYAAYANICPLTQDADGNTTCMAHPYFSPDAPQAGLPPAERTTPVYTFSAPESPPVCSGRDEEVWLELSATWWGKRTTPENQAQSGKSGGVEIAHPKGILTSLKPDGASHLEQRLHWRLVTPSNRPDLLETLPATMASDPFPRLIPHARLNISEPGMYDIELVITGDDGDVLLLDKAQVLTQGVDLDAFWPGTKDEPGPLVPDAEENDPLNLFTSVNDDDDNVDNIVDHDPIHSPIIDAEDDEIITLIIRQLTPETLPGSGTGTLTLTASEGLRLFQADGLQALEAPDLSLDLTNPTGPLADVLTQDVVLLLEAYQLSENTRLELVYTEDGQEVARDEVHLTVFSPDMTGGFTLGDTETITPSSPQALRTFSDTSPQFRQSQQQTEGEQFQKNIRWVDAVKLQDQYGREMSRWVVCDALSEDQPLSVLVPVPEKILKAAQFYASMGKQWELGMSYYFQGDGWKDGIASNKESFQLLADAYNGILSLLNWFFKLFDADYLLNQVIESSKISKEDLASGYFRIDSITNPGKYLIRFYLRGKSDQVEKLSFPPQELFVLKLNLTIYHGNESKTEVADSQEANRGALTVINRNDTDADGIIDLLDTHVIATGDGQNEVDLMKLSIHSLYPVNLVDKLFFGDTQETLKLKVVSGTVKLWERSTKWYEILPIKGSYEFPISELNNTVWVEVIEPSNKLGDIKLELELMGGKDTVVATGIWPEIDVREAARHENRAGRDDPRMDGDDVLARNKLLVWHDAGNDNAITFEVIKTDIPDGTQFINNNTPIWIQLEEKEDLNNLNTWQKGEKPFCERLDNNSATYPQTHWSPLIVLDNKDFSDLLSNCFTSSASWASCILSAIEITEQWKADVIVKYGIDYNDSGDLSGDEVKGQYEVFGITQFDYEKAIWRYDKIYLPLAVTHLADALCYRFSHGEWEESEWWLGNKDYRPDEDASCAPNGKANSCTCSSGNLLSCPRNTKENLVSRDLTHNVGAIFTNYSTIVDNVDSRKGQYPRSYFEADVTVPVYSWNKDNDASELIRNETNYFRKKHLERLLKKKYQEVEAAYQNGTVIDSTTDYIIKEVTLAYSGSWWIDFTPLFEIGLGGATVHSGTLKVLVRKSTNIPDLYDVSQKVELVSFEIEDGFDYNYFKGKEAKPTLASVSGSSIQVGFEQSNSVPHAGQVPREKIDISGLHHMAPQNHQFLRTIEWFRIRANDNWSVIDKKDDGEHEMSIDWFKWHLE